MHGYRRPPYSATTPFSRRISHTRSGRIGISTCVTPRWDSASTTALAIAGGGPHRSRLTHALGAQRVMR